MTVPWWGWAAGGCWGGGVVWAGQENAIKPKTTNKAKAWLNDVCGFPPFRQIKSERMGHGAFLRIGPRLNSCSNSSCCASSGRRQDGAPNVLAPVEREKNFMSPGLSVSLVFRWQWRRLILGRGEQRCGAGGRLQRGRPR